MDEEMRKRLEEAAEKYINNHNNYLCSAFLKDRLKEAHIAGAEHGYKEAITQAKEWLKEHFHDIPQPDPDLINLHPVDVEADYWSMESMLADFEADMNKLWED